MQNCEESEDNEWNAGAKARGRQLRTESMYAVVRISSGCRVGGTCHFGFGNQICMLSSCCSPEKINLAFVDLQGLFSLQFDMRAHINFN